MSHQLLPRPLNIPCQRTLQPEVADILEDDRRKRLARKRAADSTTPPKMARKDHCKMNPVRLQHFFTT